MHRISIVEVKNYRGGILRMPQFNVNGEIVTEPILGPDKEPIIDPSTGSPITKPKATDSANVLNCLDYLLMDFPRERLTMKHISECVRLQAKIAEATEQKLDHLDLEDAQFDWLVSVLKDDRIGVPMFGLNMTSLLSTIGATI